MLGSKHGAPICKNMHISPSALWPISLGLNLDLWVSGRDIGDRVTDSCYSIPQGFKDEWDTFGVRHKGAGKGRSEREVRDFTFVGVWMDSVVSIETTFWLTQGRVIHKNLPQKLTPGSAVNRIYGNTGKMEKVEGEQRMEGRLRAHMTLKKCPR